MLEYGFQLPSKRPGKVSCLTACSKGKLYERELAWVTAAVQQHSKTGQSELAAYLIVYTQQPVQ